MEKNVDYIIVGDGFAGMFFALQLIFNNKTFVLFSEGKKGASKISAGIVNPVVLKKFTTFDGSLEQVNFLKDTLEKAEKLTGRRFIINQPVRRIFHDEKEKETWLKKSEKENLMPFLSKEFSEFDGIENPFGCGTVSHSFRVDVPTFFSEMLHYFHEKKILIKEKFDYNLLQPRENKYQNVNYSKIVFSEGMAANNNPYFGNIPLIPNKGHHISVEFSEDFKRKETFKKKHFLFPLNKTEYYYGGTYDRENLSEEIDGKAIDQLKNGLEEIITLPYSVVQKEYAFRPTVKDRKPILGKHSDFHSLYVFNGLGTRGLLNGAFYSKILFDYADKEIPLPEEVDLERFQ